MSKKDKKPEENPSLPTGKSYISFSELKDRIECSFRHKLKHIDKIDMFEENVNTNFGTAIHASCEDYVETREMKYEIALDMIVEAWEKYGFPDLGEWLTQANAMLEAIPNFLDKKFPGWKLFKAEEELMEQIGGEHKDVCLKGFIDAIVEWKGKIILIDWKTSGSGWSDWKRNDELTTYQLLLYVKFWAQKHNVPIEKIEAGFVVMNRDLKNPERIEYIPIITDKKKIRKSLTVLNNNLTTLKRNQHFKEWKYANPQFQKSCRFCDYNGTEYCP